MNSAGGSRRGPAAAAGRRAPPSYAASSRSLKANPVSRGGRDGAASAGSAAPGGYAANDGALFRVFTPDTEPQPASDPSLDMYVAPAPADMPYDDAYDDYDAYEGMGAEEEPVFEVPPVVAPQAAVSRRSSQPSRRDGSHASSATSKPAPTRPGRRAQAKTSPRRQKHTAAQAAAPAPAPAATGAGGSYARPRAAAGGAAGGGGAHGDGYTPKSLDEYLRNKPKDYVELGKLGPDLDADELVEKRANAARVRHFSEQLRRVNAKEVKRRPDGGRPKPAPKPEREKAKAQRQRALEFAKNVPKPKVKARPAPTRPAASKAGGGSYSDLAAAAQPTAMTAVEELEARHDVLRSEADAIRREFGL